MDISSYEIELNDRVGGPMDCKIRTLLVTVMFLVPSTQVFAMFPDEENSTSSTLEKIGDFCSEIAFNVNRPTCELKVKPKSMDKHRLIVGDYPLNAVGEPLLPNNKMIYFRGDDNCSEKSAKAILGEKRDFYFRQEGLPGMGWSYNSLDKEFTFEKVMPSPKGLPQHSSRDYSYDLDGAGKTCLDAQKQELIAALKDLGGDAKQIVALKRKGVMIEDLVNNTRRGVDCPFKILLQDNQAVAPSLPEPPTISVGKDLPGESSKYGMILELRAALNSGGQCKIIGRDAIQKILKGSQTNLTATDITEKIVPATATGNQVPAVH
jgi:hypothetical protein